MTVGNQATVSSVNDSLSRCATEMRDLCQRIGNLQQFLNGANGLGLAGLQALAPGSASQPYSAADAQVALSMTGYLNTVAGVFWGTVQQGGTGGTGATKFNFSDAVSPLYAGQ